jgi:hypothetical protein
MTREEILGTGWSYTAQEGLNHTYHRGFNGTSWIEMYHNVEEDRYHIYTRSSSSGGKMTTYYWGPCPTVEDMKFLVKLLGI